MTYTLPTKCQISNLSSIYENLFGINKIDGTFVEVGAYDGETFSNTSGLADMGWVGLYIEPIPEYAQNCINRHAKNKVVVANCAVGTETKILELHVGGTLTTSLPDQVRIYDEIEWAKNHHHGLKIQVKQFPLETLLKKTSVKPGFELLVVDVEGTELDVLKSFDIDYWKPKAMIIEIEDGHESFQKYPEVVARCKELRSYILEKNYVEVYKDHINTVFARN